MGRQETTPTTNTLSQTKARHMYWMYYPIEEKHLGAQQIPGDVIICNRYSPVFNQEAADQLWSFK